MATIDEELETGTDDASGAAGIAAVLTPRRRRGVELLDDPSVADVVRVRSHEDLVRSNVVFGGRRAVRLALDAAFRAMRDRDARAPRAVGPASPPPRATLLDVGTGLGDLAADARRRAAAADLPLRTIGLDGAPALLRAARPALDHALGGDALRLPLRDGSVDVVLCSQVLHHFEHDDVLRVLAELDRVARVRVIVGDLRRSRIAAFGFRLASGALRFDPITRHDGIVSVRRGFTAAELRAYVRTATGADAVIRHRLGFRLTAAWTPRRRACAEAS